MTRPLFRQLLDISDQLDTSIELSLVGQVGLEPTTTGL